VPDTNSLIDQTSWKAVLNLLSSRTSSENVVQRLELEEKAINGLKRRGYAELAELAELAQGCKGGCSHQQACAGNSNDEGNNEEACADNPFHPFAQCFNPAP
jgi:hypothetical protein